MCDDPTLERRIKALKARVKELEAALTLIGDVAYGRNGYTGDAEKLGELVDEIYGYVVDATKEVDDE